MWCPRFAVCGARPPCPQLFSDNVEHYEGCESISNVYCASASSLGLSWRRKVAARETARGRQLRRSSSASRGLSHGGRAGCSEALYWQARNTGHHLLVEARQSWPRRPDSCRRESSPSRMRMWIVPMIFKKSSFSFSSMS